MRNLLIAVALTALLAAPAAAQFEGGPAAFTNGNTLVVGASAGYTLLDIGDVGPVEDLSLWGTLLTPERGGDDIGVGLDLGQVDNAARIGGGYMRGVGWGGYVRFIF